MKFIDLFVGIFYQKTVDSVLSVFTKAVADLDKVAENEFVKAAKAKEEADELEAIQIVLRADSKRHVAEAERAYSVKAKIEKLLK